jgi:hypothetical protein
VETQWRSASTLERQRLNASSLSENFMNMRFRPSRQTIRRVLNRAPR